MIRQQYKTWVVALISLCYETVSTPMMFLLTDIADPSAVTAALGILMILGFTLMASSAQAIVLYRDQLALGKQSCGYILLINYLFISNAIGYITTAIAVLYKNFLKRSSPLPVYTVLDVRSVLLCLYILTYLLTGFIFVSTGLNGKIDLMHLKPPIGFESFHVYIHSENVNKKHLLYINDHDSSEILHPGDLVVANETNFHDDSVHVGDLGDVDYIPALKKMNENNLEEMPLSNIPSNLTLRDKFDRLYFEDQKAFHKFADFHKNIQGNHGNHKEQHRQMQISNQFNSFIQSNYIFNTNPFKVNYFMIQVYIGLAYLIPLLIYKIYKGYDMVLFFFSWLQNKIILGCKTCFLCGAVKSSANSAAEMARRASIAMTGSSAHSNKNSNPDKNVESNNQQNNNNCNERDSENVFSSEQFIDENQGKMRHLQELQSRQDSIMALL